MKPDRDHLIAEIVISGNYRILLSISGPARLSERAAVLVLIIGNALLWMAKFLFWPCRFAWRFFTPQIKVARAVERVAWARTVVGLAVCLTTLVRYDDLGVSAFEWSLVKAGLSSVAGTAAVLIVSAVVMGLVTTDRDVLIHRMIRGPLAAAAVWNGAVWGYFLVLRAVYPDHFLGGFLWTLVSLWVACFAMVGAFQVYRHVYNARDAHPLIPALAAPWFSALATAAEITIGEGTPNDGVPKAVSVSISVLGTLCVIALSWWEYRFIARTYSITLRSGAPAIDVDPVTGRAHWVQTMPPTESARHPHRT
jgi:hypothetical protein